MTDKSTQIQSPKCKYIPQEVPMYTLLRSISFHTFLAKQLPALALSVFTAERFYKFHSFTLECIAFLGTWYALDFVITSLVSLWKKAGYRSL